MRMYDIIAKKRDGGALDKKEIRFFIEDYIKKDIPDYQAAAFLMAAFLNGLNGAETAELTLAMADSGERADLSLIKGALADKHSTGGVADTTTLIAAPIAAACGVKIAKMSGRGLGHTGGTIDKLESIPGFMTGLSKAKFISQVNDIGIAVTGQTADMCPADKMLYALRDVTATVESIPLIASSIMSKKIASGAPAIVLDVKTGNGAFMKKYEDSLKLAAKMVDIGLSAGRSMSALVTDMNEPLGRAAGNALEVYEAVGILKNKVDGRLKTLSCMLAAELINVSGLEKDIKKALYMAANALENGKALNKFKEMVIAQGGDVSYIDKPGKLDNAKIRHELSAEKEGFIAGMDTQRIGAAAGELGAGRKKIDDIIDMSAGIWMHKEIGDKVKKDEPICTLYANDNEKLNTAFNILKNCFTISDKSCEKLKLVYARVTGDGVTEL